MATWVCTKCGNKTEGRCRPGKCSRCGAPKEDIKKDETAESGSGKS